MILQFLQLFKFSPNQKIINMAYIVFTLKGYYMFFSLLIESFDLSILFANAKFKLVSSVSFSSPKSCPSWPISYIFLSFSTYLSKSPPKKTLLICAIARLTHLMNYNLLVSLTLIYFTHSFLVLD